MVLKNLQLLNAYYVGKFKLFLKQAEFFSRINACVCYKEFLSYKEKLIYLSKVFNFQIDNLASLKAANVETTCLICGEKQVRSAVQIFLAPRHCPKCSNHKDSELSVSLAEAQKRLNELTTRYTLLEYQGITKAALVKHECGFVFKVNKLHELISGHIKGCPRCFSSKSRGEQRIENYLQNYKINFIAQKTFLPSNKKNYYRFDFFLPDYRIAIEYQGEQHFRDNGFAREGLNKIQERDTIKREYCQQNNIILIEIPYTQLQKIEEVLSFRLNDYGVNTSN